VNKESAVQKAWPTGKRGHGLHPATHHQSSLAVVLTGAWTEQMRTGLLGCYVL